MGNGRDRPHHPTGPLGLPNGVGAVTLQPGMTPQAKSGPPANKEVPRLFTPEGRKIAGWGEPPPTKTDGGLEIPENATNLYTSVIRVVAVGPECKQIKPGDRVLIGGGVPVGKVYMGPHVYMVAMEEDVYGVIDDPVPTA